MLWLLSIAGLPDWVLPVWYTFGALCMSVVVIGTCYVFWSNRESAQSKQARKYADRIWNKMESSCGNMHQDPRQEVDYWLLALMNKQLQTAIETNSDLMQATSIMGSAIPEIMIWDAAKRAKMTKEEVRSRQAELKEEICRD